MYECLLTPNVIQVVFFIPSNYKDSYHWWNSSVRVLSILLLAVLFRSTTLFVFVSYLSSNHNSQVTSCREQFEQSSGPFLHTNSMQTLFPILPQQSQETIFGLFTLFLSLRKIIHTSKIITFYHNDTYVPLWSKFFV